MIGKGQKKATWKVEPGRQKKGGGIVFMYKQRECQFRSKSLDFQIASNSGVTKFADTLANVQTLVVDGPCGLDVWVGGKGENINYSSYW